MVESRIFPIQLREELVVLIQDIPVDLKQSEADKICRIIQALVDERIK